MNGVESVTRGIFVIVMLVIVSVQVSLAEEDPNLPIDGVFGMESYGGSALLAVRVPVPGGSAVSGITWFNNDEQTVIDRILVGTGFPLGPGSITEFAEVAQNVQGGSSQWSSVEFEMPVVPSQDALYIVFSLPASECLTDQGTGGGPGIGYCSAELGLRGWLSGEGEVWARLHDDYGFTVLPSLVPVEPGMLVKCLGESGEDEIPIPEPYLQAGPNPFNPAIGIGFGLKVGAHTRLDIYDLRGRRICRLIDEFQPAGEHEIQWRGMDMSNRPVASGVYIMRLKSGQVDMKRSVTMVR